MGRNERLGCFQRRNRRKIPFRLHDRVWSSFFLAPNGRIVPMFARSLASTEENPMMVYLVKLAPTPFMFEAKNISPIWLSDNYDRISGIFDFDNNFAH